jgi:plastocyanin
VCLVLLAGLLFAAAPAMADKPVVSSTQTYEVLVGFEQSNKGVGVNAYFPETVTIHVGDTVRWLQNSNDIHTVTFLAGTEPAPLIVPAASLGFPSDPSPLLFNPLAVNPAGPADGVYNGVGYANSGLMGREPGQVAEFSLTFSAAGTFDYLCLVHGVMMSGRVVVVAPDVAIPSPNQAMAEGRQEIAEYLSQVPAVMRAAKEQIQPLVTNPDGTTTHHVWIGYADGQIDLMQFFPDKLTVRPGDTVIWEMSPQNDAPHTVTFLNGEPEPDLVIPVERNGSLLLYANPAVFFPQLPSPELTRSGIYSSGVMEPIPGTTFELVIGDMKPGLEPFLCLLHDSSGMEGVLMVVP